MEGCLGWLIFFVNLDMVVIYYVLIHYAGCLSEGILGKINICFLLI